MRAIGKGSLASILAMGLHVTRIILFDCAGRRLTIAMAIIPFVPFAALGCSTGSGNINLNGDGGVELSDFFEVAYAFRRLSR